MQSGINEIEEDCISQKYKSLEDSQSIYNYNMKNNLMPHQTLSLQGGGKQHDTINKVTNKAPNSKRSNLNNNAVYAPSKQDGGGIGP